MLFNSYEFIFLFFPTVLLGYFLLGRLKLDTNLWLLLASLGFYGYWDVRFLPLLIGSIVANWLIARAILRFDRKKFFFGLGLCFNLGLLGVYKYLDFAIEIVNEFGGGLQPLGLILPLGISFFTITQLLYLFDCYEGVAREQSPIEYALFVSFFPHLMAGPILYHRQMFKQFANEKLRAVDWQNLSGGLVLFSIGLIKKVLIADQLSPYVGLGFASTETIDCLTAWLTSIGYMLQLYFDFSGYSDMAVGLSRMMNLDIPINFNSPYRAASIINFWQRWHISLTNAITACIYIPLLRRLKTKTLAHTTLASFVTFFIVGIWHGAGWTFVAFALLNSVGIVVNYVWKFYKLAMPSIAAHLITLSYILLTMIFFRAASIDDALNMLGAMLGANGIVFPQKIVSLASTVGIELTVGNVPGSLDKLVFVAAILIVAFAPNSNQSAKKITPTPALAAAIAIGLFLAVLRLSSVTEFLYFQF